ncbi:hypothetical protein [uncultured Microscilla sp.]|uniref:hypothetical protein n=1 Tax=uncultured Microscilla sp. TaxID=432653 RepID=UPI00262A87F2|nr:hypothetical protein [uncultured Microscilla sp.]
MQKVKIYFAVFIACLFTIVACKKKDDITPTTDLVTEPEVKTPGKFGLTQMHANKRVRKQVIDGVTYVPYQTPQNQRTSEVANFDLGNLKASKSFYFILSNTGDQAITDVTIESNNPQFEIFPKTIDKLAGASENGIVPLLELGVIHGNRLNGVGFQSLLPMGDNTVEVTIKGKTQGENGEEAVELKAQVKLFAQLMDVEFYVDGQKIDYNILDYLIGKSGVFYPIKPGNTFKVKNIGNVDFMMEYETVQEPLLNTQSKLAVGEEKEFAFIFSQQNGNQITLKVKLDAAGATTNPFHISVQPDGKAYFYVVMNK